MGKSEGKTDLRMGIFSDTKDWIPFLRPGANSLGNSRRGRIRSLCIFKHSQLKKLTIFFLRGILFMALYALLVGEYNLYGIPEKKTDWHHMPGQRSPQWIEDGPLYEIFVRAFSEQGTFRQVEQRLDYMQDLGVSAIWLMPVYPIGQKGRKGKLGSPYSVQDYFKVNPELGTAEDLRSLINNVHRRGMHIIVDMVANHVSNDYIEMKNRPFLFARDAQGNFTREVADWSDVTDFDYSRTETRLYMKEVMKYWINTFDFDGFRCDVAGMVPTDFWEETVAELRQIKPDIYMLAEWEDPALQVRAFHSTYDWTLYHLLKDIRNGKKPAVMAVRWVEEKRAFYPQNALPLRFIENHDEQRAAAVFGKEGFKPFIAFIFSIYGVPLIYNGQEWGESQKPTLFDKVHINWDKRDDEIRAFYKKLIRLRKLHPALPSRQLTPVGNNQPDKIISFLKSAEQERILVVLNTAEKEFKIALNVNSELSGKTFRDLFSGKRIKEKNDQIEMKLEPFSAMWWLVE